ncbi:hypothetical protein AB0P40_44210, partial [Streptomyces sp. NPDC079189]|uniref:hypothetical protein n=1 Tax=Streptomyces sp. NPDC079189 TaxID=3154514 RepID=UPI00342FA1B3
MQDATLWDMARRIPAALGRTFRLAWSVDRHMVVTVLLCQLLSGVGTAARQHPRGDGHPLQDQFVERARRTGPLQPDASSRLRIDYEHHGEESARSFFRDRFA